MNVAIIPYMTTSSLSRVRNIINVIGKFFEKLEVLVCRGAFK